MLQRLHIRNFAVIEEVNVEFGAGLNVLTGETGAGKSILVDAIASLLGGRLSSDMVRRGGKIAVVEGAFAVTDAQKKRLGQLVAGQEIELLSDQFTLRRELTEAGRSRALINEQVVGVGVLKSVAPSMIDLNMQGEQYALNAARNQLDLLDQYAGCVRARKGVEGLYQQRLKSLSLLRDLRAQLEEGRRTRDFLEFQLAEIEKVDPQPGEDEALAAERVVLINQDKISNLERGVYQALYEDEESVVSRLRVVRKQLGALSGLDPSYTEHRDQIEAAAALVTDVAEAVFSLHNSRTWSEERLEQVESRLSEIEQLKRRHGSDLAQVLATRESLQNSLEQVEGGALREADALAELRRIEDEYLRAAELLSEARRSAAGAFGAAVTKGLRELSLPDARFVVEVRRAEGRDADARSETDSDTRYGEDSGAHTRVWSATGFDKIEFLFSANRGTEPRPLAQVASGGELSRLALVVQSVCRENLSRETWVANTLLLDEVDVGVSGQVAETLGRKLSALARKQQVVCITHQPQIARFADHHFAVRKTTTADHVRSDVVKLNHKQRVKELARLIAADENAEIAQQTADWLLQNT